MREGSGYFEVPFTFDPRHRLVAYDLQVCGTMVFRVADRADHRHRRVAYDGPYILMTRLYG